jgi:peptidoglycan/LPS O-acetylase OafA/YrhL
VVCLYEAIAIVRLQGISKSLLGKLLLNLTFTFGFANPGATSLVTGGWSLGIEFVFYLLFPVLLPLVRRPRAPWLVVGALGIQLVFINLVLAGTTLEAAWVPYTQFIAFVGYFVAGVWLGVRHVDARRWRPLPWAWPVWIAVLAPVALCSGASQTSSVAGARGVLLTLACVAAVALATRLELPRPLARLAGWLGDASYPMYLAHPIVFRFLTAAGVIAAWTHRAPIAFLTLALLATFVIATLVYRLLEEPILRWGKLRLAR